MEFDSPAFLNFPGAMMTIEKAYEIIEESNHYASEFWEVIDASNSYLIIKHAMSWDFNDMYEVSKLFGTKDINIMNYGCETCGNGSEIMVTLK